MFESIDLYCERTGPEFWSEPVNALTNIAFLVAAWMGWRLAARRGNRGGDVRLLLGLIVAIGIGSFLFHTFATGWAALLDVLPILLLQLAFLWFYTGRVIGIRVIGRIGLQVAFLGLVVFFGRFPGVLGGSLAYAPGLLLLGSIGTYHFAAGKANRPVILVAAGLFLFSLAFRSVDELLCPHLTFGTHFMWHLCNATVLYLAFVGYLANCTNGRLRPAPQGGPLP